MLPWQRRVRDHQRQLQIKAFIGACSVYVIIVFLLLSSTHTPNEPIRLKVYRPGAHGASPVLFMHNPQPRKASDPQGSIKGAAVKPVEKKIKTPGPVKPLPKKVVKPVQKKVVEKKKEVSKAQQVKPEKKVKKKKPVEKKLPAKPAQKNKPEVKEPPKKIEKEKKLADKKSETKQSETKKTEQKKIEPAKKGVAPEPIQQKAVELPGQKLAPESNDQVNQEASLYVGQPYDQESKAHMALSRSISRSWKPPHGLSDQLVSLLSVIIGKNGEVKEVVIEKKSGVLAHDMSAKAALWRVEYPREFWGKTVSIVFGPDKSL